MAEYKYGMRLRGFSPGAQPKYGLIRREDSPVKKYHDILIYDRPLTERDVQLRTGLFRGDKMKVLSVKERRVVSAVLAAIDRELRRCFWNKYQFEMDSPFNNTGSVYACSAFKVTAYDWNDDNGDNFVYFKDNLHVDWYKHSGRGMYVEVPDDWTMDRLPDMLDDCIKAIREDFREDEE